MSDAAVGGFVMSLIFGFLGFVLGAWLLRVIMLRHVERQLAAILKELRSRATAAVVAGVLLSSVACASTYHAKKSKSGDGYAETMIAADTYLVSFTATENTPPDTIALFVLYRAAELTLEKGFDHFVMGGEDTQVKRNSLNAALFGGPVTETPTRSATIRMGKGPKPSDNPTAYDARELTTNLKAKVLPKP